MINIKTALLSSPLDKSELKIISENLLIDKSGNEFVIKNGIPRFVDSDNYANAFGKQLVSSTEDVTQSMLPHLQSWVFSAEPKTFAH